MNVAGNFEPRPGGLYLIKGIFLILFCIASSCHEPNDALTIKCPNGFCEQLYYGEASNQWLLIHQALADAPTPVYVWAHPNGSSPNDPGSARSMDESIIENLMAAGISYVSWESVAQVQDDQDLIQTENDFALMMNWLLKNAARYNIDSNKIVVGGGSRGTLATWPRMKEFHMIKGFYGVQAFPDGGWLLRDYTTYINSDFPRIQLMYQEAPGTSDPHKPENGMRIVDRYTELGIGERSYLEHSVMDKGLYDDLVLFILSCI